jgi:hypothetical protein
MVAANPSGLPIRPIGSFAITFARPSAVAPVKRLSASTAAPLVHHTHGYQA